MTEPDLNNTSATNSATHEVLKGKSIPRKSVTPTKTQTIDDPTAVNSKEGKSKQSHITTTTNKKTKIQELATTGH